jgi:hypothetical protein
MTDQEVLHIQAAQLIVAAYEQHQDRQFHVDGLQSVQLAHMHNVVRPTTDGEFGGFDARCEIYMQWFDGTTAYHCIELDETLEQVRQRVFEMLQNRA